MEIRVRTAEEGDLNTVCDLADQIGAQHHQNLPETFAPPDSHSRDRGFWREQVVSQDVLFLLACVKDNIVGFVTASMQAVTDIPFLQKTSICRIHTIVVASSFQGVGVGTILMNHAEQWASDRGAAEIRLEVMAFNSGAHAFYLQRQYHAHSHILSKPIP